MHDRTRLCLTLELGKSVRIGQDILTIAAIAERPSFSGSRQIYNEVLLYVQALPKTLWAVESTEVFFPDWSVQINEINRSKAKIAVHAPIQMQIERIK